MAGFKLFREVLRSEDSEVVLESAAAPGLAKITYRSGQWSEAPEFLACAGYGPTYFDTEEEAVHLGQLLLPVTKGSLEVWRVEAENILEPLPPPLVALLLAEGIAGPSGKEWERPEHMRMAMRVMPTECVYVLIPPTGQPIHRTN